MLPVFSSGRGSWELRVWPTGKVWQALPEQEWQPDKVGHIGWGSWKPQSWLGIFGKIGFGIGPLNFMQNEMGS